MIHRPPSALIPAVFVLIWATGFIVARLVAPFVEPMTFLTLRFALAAAILGVAAVAAGARWPGTVRGCTDALVAGILLHGLYLGGVFWAVRHGLPAGITALIGSVQPLLTALLAIPLLGEPVPALKWAGIATGFGGVGLVVAPKVGGGDYGIVELLACLAGVAGLTLGTIWHKRRSAAFDLRTGTCLQFVGALAISAPIALLTESREVTPSWQLVVGLAWAVLGLSIGAIALLLVLLRRGAVVGVSSLLFLVPPVTALMGFVGFGETLEPIQLAGMALAATGVAIAARA